MARPLKVGLKQFNRRSRRCLAWLALAEEQTVVCERYYLLVLQFGLASIQLTGEQDALVNRRIASVGNRQQDM